MHKRSALRYNEAVAHDGNALCAAIGPTSGLVLATGGDDCSVNVWRLGKPHVIASFRDFKKPATCVCFSAQDANLAAGSESGAVKVWSMAKGKVSCSFAAHRSAVTCLSFHPRVEHVLASGGADGRVQVLDASMPPGNILNTYTYVPPTKARAAVVTAAPITCISFSPPGNWLAAGDESGRVIVWDTGRGVQLLAWDGANPSGAAVHNLVSAAVGAAPTLGGMSNASSSSGPGHRGRVTSLAFHPDEFVLVSGGEDRIVRVWDCDPKAPQPLLAITPTDTGPIRSLIFMPQPSSPSMRWPLAVITDTRLRVWHVPGVTDEEMGTRGEAPVTTDVLSVAWPGVSAAWVGSNVRSSSGSSTSHLIVVSLRHSFMTAHGVDVASLCFTPPLPVVQATRMSSPDPAARVSRSVDTASRGAQAADSHRRPVRSPLATVQAASGKTGKPDERAIPSGAQLSGTPVYSVSVSGEEGGLHGVHEEGQLNRQGQEEDDQFSVGDSEVGEEEEERNRMGEEQQAKLEWARAQGAQVHAAAQAQAPPSASVAGGARWADLPASPPLVTRNKRDGAVERDAVQESKDIDHYDEGKSESSSEEEDMGNECEADLVPSTSAHQLSVFQVDQEDSDEDTYSPDVDHAAADTTPPQPQLLVSPKKSPARRRAPAAAVDLGALQAVMQQVAAVKQAMEHAKRGPLQAVKAQQEHRQDSEQSTVPASTPAVASSLPLPPPAYPALDPPSVVQAGVDSESDTLPSRNERLVGMVQGAVPRQFADADSAECAGGSSRRAPTYDPSLGATMVGWDRAGLQKATTMQQRAPGDFVPCVRDAPAGLAFEAFLPDATPCGFGAARREPLGATLVQATRAGSAAAMRGGSAHGGRPSPTDAVLTAVRAKRSVVLDTLKRRQASVRMSAAAWTAGDVRQAMHLAATAADAGAMADILCALTGVVQTQDLVAASDLFAKGSARVTVSAPAACGAGTSAVEALLLNLEQAAAIMHLAHAAMSDAAPLWQSVGAHAAFSMFRAYSPIIRSLITAHLGPLPTESGSLPLDSGSLSAKNLDPTVEERLERAGHAASALETLRRRAGSMLKSSGGMEKGMASTVAAFIRGYDSWRTSMAAD